MYYYSQEARCYALLIMLSAAALLCWQRALEQPDGRRLWLWALMSALAVLTHYFAAFLFLPEAVILARRIGWRRAAPATGAVVLVGLALLPLAVRQRSDGKASWIEGASLANRLAESAKQFLVGLYGPVEILTAAVAGLLALAAIVLLMRRGRREERMGAATWRSWRALRSRSRLLLSIRTVMDVYDGRNVIAAWVPIAVLIAAGLGVARAPRAGAAIGAGLLAVSLAVIIATNMTTDTSAMTGAG